METLLHTGFPTRLRQDKRSEGRSSVSSVGGSSSSSPAPSPATARRREREPPPSQASDGGGGRRRQSIAGHSAAPPHRLLACLLAGCPASLFAARLPLISLHTLLSAPTSLPQKPPAGRPPTRGSGRVDERRCRWRRRLRLRPDEMSSPEENAEGQQCS